MPAADRLVSSCSGREAPKTTDPVRGSLRHQASATAAGSRDFFLSVARHFSTAAIFAGVRSHIVLAAPALAALLPCSAATEYLPVSTPSLGCSADASFSNDRFRRL